VIGVQPAVGDTTTTTTTTTTATTTTPTATTTTPFELPLAQTFYSTNDQATSWIVDGFVNPTISLQCGLSYAFNISASLRHPFDFKTENSLGSVNPYDTGVIYNGAIAGSVYFTVRFNAPPNLYDVCSLHDPMNGTLNILCDRTVRFAFNGSLAATLTNTTALQ
jgi:hypothetical protein